MRRLVIAYSLYVIAIWIFFPLVYPELHTAASRYASIGHAVYFSRLPLLPMLLYIVWKNHRWKELAASLERRLSRLPAAAVFVLILVLLYGVVQLPFRLAGYWNARNEAISVQPFSDWLGEYALSLLLLYLAVTAVVFLSQLLMKKFPKNWWISLWVMLVPCVIFVVYVQPIWIDPLYEDFHHLREGQLRTQIQQLTAEAGIPDATLLEIGKSAETVTYNAYVTGVFDSARVVLYDTTIEGLEQEEVLFIVAHEIGHYVLHHVYWGTAGFLVLGLFLLWMTKRLSAVYLAKRKLQAHQLQAMPLFLLLLTGFQLISQPVSLYVSREMEQQADAYALEHAPDTVAGIRMFQKMQSVSQGDPDPWPIITWLRSTHPPMQDRIKTIKEYTENKQKQ
ncbi:Zn-dependent protease with chaperone function [Terribacillus aidingensis]|uniref:Zn-dependent protease with chaperone function n=1 Tax=Terribacillus aidingensis TaxID=586416 RepID=A0A285P2G2_9BACI|nr:M48 family metalloprotease [Terribacillus aidingensis]SNZ14346.1 Zn-dependent protease with chaperone function [Terribacillus aidingensis]